MERKAILSGPANLSFSDAVTRSEEIYRAMLPARKWEEAVRLREAAWKLKMAGVKALHPEWCQQKLEEAVREIFLYAVS